MSSKELLENIFYKALDAVKAEKIVKKNLHIDNENIYISDQKIAINSFKDLYLFSVGKAGFTMAKAAENILKKNIKGGIAISLEKKKLKYIKHSTSSHPVVDKKSIKSTNILIDEIKKIDKDDLFIFFLSGGASAMIEKPIDGLTLGDFQKISKALLTSGIDIKALNTVRKSISVIKGGKLGNMFKSKGFTLVLSDVIGDDLNTIGSAPMYNGKIKHFLIGNNTIALKSAKEFIKDKVEKTKIVTTSLDMPSQKAADYISNTIKRYDKQYDSFCLLIGGETTTKVSKNGLGGRNSELALRIFLNGSIKDNISILCAGSDGVDGSSPANGAFVDSSLYEIAAKKSLDAKKHLKQSNSYLFFKEFGYEFTTGITGTNVMDFVIVLKNNQQKGD
jgi:glycerate-2-kinase